jgi:DNA-binding transcriptional regulator WhiA
MAASGNVSELLRKGRELTSQCLCAVSEQLSCENIQKQFSHNVICVEIENLKSDDELYKMLKPVSLLYIQIIVSETMAGLQKAQAYLVYIKGV